MKILLLICIAGLAFMAQTLMAAETSSSTNPTQLISPEASNSPSDKAVTTFIITEINAYRREFKLPPVRINDETCNFAKIRAHEIISNFSHDGFNQRVRNHALPYAHWSVITENIAMTSDYKQVVDMWRNSPGHAKNMRADTPFVCVIQDGKYFAYLGMKP